MSSQFSIKSSCIKCHNRHKGSETVNWISGLPSNPFSFMHNSLSVCSLSLLFLSSLLSSSLLSHTHTRTRTYTQHNCSFILFLLNLQIPRSYHYAVFLKFMFSNNSVFVPKFSHTILLKMYKQSSIFVICSAKQNLSLNTNMVTFVILRHPVNTLVTKFTNPDPCELPHLKY